MSRVVTPACAGINAIFSRSGSHKAGWARIGFIVLLLSGLAGRSLEAQSSLGAITGTVKDASGAAVPAATVKAVNIATNLQVTEHSDSNGSYLVPNLPVGMYQVTFTKDGFETETHTQILVQGDRTSTVDSALKVGSVSATVEVTSTPLMNQVDMTNGYVVDQLTIREYAAGHGKLHATGDSGPGGARGFSCGHAARTRGWAIRPSSPTASATPATASR